MSSSQSQAAIADRLAQAMSASGIGPTKLAQEFGHTNHGRFSLMRSGKQAIPVGEIDEISAVLGVRPEWLLTGKPPMLAEPSAMAGDGIRYVPLEDDGYFEGQYEPRVPGALPEIDVYAGAGEGAVGEVVAFQIGRDAYSAHRVVGEWLFPDGFLSNEAKARRSTTLVVPVVGDSMAPTYNPGDRLLVDTSQNTLQNDGVYVISDGESAPQVKRLQRVLFSTPSEVHVISDNPAHTTQTVLLSELHILGRVAGVVSIR